nr:MAG TPA: hypothetical protein [Caudoviricetes sp.]
MTNSGISPHRWISPLYRTPPLVAFDYHLDKE